MPHRCSRAASASGCSIIVIAVVDINAQIAVRQHRLQSAGLRDAFEQEWLILVERVVRRLQRQGIDEIVATARAAGDRQRRLARRVVRQHAAPGGCGEQWAGGGLGRLMGSVGWRDQR